MTHRVRQAPVSLLFALALALCLSAVLTSFPAVPAYAQSSTPSVSIRTLQTRMPEGGQALFTITRAGGDISQPLTVRIYTWEPQHPRNTFGSYYDGAAYHNVTFAAGSDTVTLLVSATDDGKDVAPAWLRADVDPPGSASYDRGSPDSATVTITDANDDVYVTISPDEAEVDEGDSVDFELTRTGDASSALTVSVRVDDPGEVMRGNHWAPAPDRPTSVEFAAGQDTATLSLETKDDQRDIPDQTLSVTLAGGDDGNGAGGFGYWLGYPHAAGVTVKDDDTAPDLALSISPEEVSEGGTLTVSVERPAGNTAEVLNGRIRIEHNRTWTDPDAPAHQTNPFEGNFHIPAGGTAWTLDIQATDNGQPELDWRYTVTLLPRDGVPDDEASQYWTVGGAAVARALDTAYIRITVTADQEVVYEGEEATFTLTRTGSLAQELTVRVITAERAGTPDATNIQFQSVTFAAGSATATLALTAAEDDEPEPDGDSLGVEVYVYPGAPYRGGDPDDAVTMVKDTGDIDIRTFQTRMREGAEALFTLTRSGAAISQPLTVRVYTWEPQHPLNNAANGYFHGAAHHEVTFEAGAESAALVVSATGDGKAPGRGAFLWAKVDPPSGAPYRIGAPVYVSIDIADADGQDAFVTVATAASEVDEGESVDFVLTRTGDTSRSLAVHVSVDDPGEVMRGNHWAPAPDRPTSVAFGVGEDRVILSLETMDDQRDIPDQPVSVTITDQGGSGYWLAYPRTAGFTVRDDDVAPELTVSFSPSEVDEGGTFFVSVERPAGNTAEVLPGRIRIEHNRVWTDPNAQAHQTNPFEENFAIWPDRTERLWQIEVPVNNLTEDDWQYTVTLLPREEVPEDEASQYWRVVGDGTATATVRDVGLPRVSFVVDDVAIEDHENSDDLQFIENVTEGETVTFILTRTGDLREPLTVRVRTEERNNAKHRFNRIDHQVIFEAGAATASFNVEVYDDRISGEPYDYLSAQIYPYRDDPYNTGDPRTVIARIDDPDASVSIRADDQDAVADGEQDSITEGETATFTLTREGYIGRALAVNVSVQDPGYFMRGNHWQPVPSIQPVRFEAGTSTTVLALPTRDDLRDIPDNSLTVTIEPDADGYYTVSAASSTAVTVRDNDVAPTVALSVDRAEITEGETFRLTLTRSGDTANPIELPLRFGPLGPPMSRTVGLNPGETQVTIPFHVEDDDLDEAEQDYYVELAPYEGLLEDAMSQYWTVEGPRFLTVTVADNDLPLVGVEAARDSYAEGRIGAIRVFRANYVEDGGIVVNLRFIDTGNVIVQPHRQGVTGDRRYFIEDDEETNIRIHLAEEDGDEADGVFIVQVLEGAGYRIDPEHSATSFVVLDNDPTPVLSVTGATVSEGGESIDFRVTLSSTVSPPSLQTVTVDYATRDGTAVAGEDYTAVRGTLTLAPEGTEGVISVPLLDDGWAEDLETFRLVVTNPANAMLPDGQTSLTITGTIEDDEPRVSVSAQSAQVMEGEPVTLILTRTGDTGEDLVFRLSIYEDHPSTFNDYSRPYVTIPAGTSTVQWDHETVDDDFDEADFTVSVSIIDYTQSTARSSFAWDGTYATATVTDNDLPEVTVEAVAEHQRHGADAVFTLTREADLTVPLTVNLSVTATDGAEGQGQAVNGFLTSQPPSTATFATGASTVTVRLGTNRLSTKAVRLTATLTSADAYNVGDPASARILSVRGTLPIVSIRARSEDVQEGNWVTFDLTRTGSTDSSLEATVKLTKWNWNARADETVTVVFDAGSATIAWSRWAEDEELNNGDTLYVAFVSGTAATYYVGLDGHPRRATVLVRDNDLPLVWLEPEMGEHVEDGVSRPTFTLYRSGDTSNALEIWFDVRDVGFVPEEYGGDNVIDPLYQLSLYFLSGATSTRAERGYREIGPLGGESRLTIQAVDTQTADAIKRTSFLYQYGLLSEDTYFLRPRYRIGRPASGFIMVHNSAIGLLIEADQSEVEEGETATFTLTRVGGTPSSRGYRMDVRVEATQEGDVISGVTPRTVSFPGYPELPAADAVHTINVSIPTIDDADYGDDGSITLTLMPSSDPNNEHTQYEIGGSYGFDVPASATIRVLDNDRPEMSISDVSAFESDGVIKFTVSVAAGPRDVSVDWATSDGSGDTAAIAGEDYTAANGTLTIPAGETTGTITVMVMDDDLHENDETLTVQLSGDSEASLVDGSATGTIKNDDFDQEVEIWTLATDRNLTEGETAMFTLRRQPPDGGVPPPGFGVTPLTVNIGVSQDGDFIAGDPPATVTFPANHLYAQLQVPTDDDQTAEPNGSVTVSLADGTGYSQGNQNQATVNLQDNDVGISITGRDAVRESVESGITFTVSLSRAAPKPVTVDVTTVDGTATSDDTVTATSLGSDFEAKSQTLTFEAGQTQKTFTVTLVDDTFDEPREEFTAQLGNASDNARLLVASATGMISDDEEELMLGVYRTRQRVAEDRGAPVDFLLELRPAANSGATASEFEVSVDWSLEGGTALPGADYLDVSGEATIPPGARSVTVEVSLVDDELHEAIFETFSFRIDGAVAADVDEDHESIEISIRDDDDVQADVAVDTESVAEGADAEFTVSLSGALSTAPVELTYAVSGTAGADDYTAPSGTLTIPALAAEATISITTLADDVEDDDETLVVTLTGATSHGRTLQVADTAAKATILDQGTLTVSITGGSATEGEEVQLTIAISPPPSYWVNVTYETVIPEGNVVGEALLGTDFQSTRSIALLTNALPSKTFTIGTIEDNLVEGDETFEVRIVDVDSIFVGAEYGPAIDIASHTAELTIIDDDVRPTNVTLAVTPDSVSESADGTPLSVTATLDGDGRLLEQLPVALSVADGTATEGEDYTAVPVMLYIPAGQANSTGPVVLFPVDDLVAGGDKTVQVTAAAAGMTATPATVTITDNETPPTGVALTVSPDEVREDAGATDLEVTATLTGGDRRPVDTEVLLRVEGVSPPAEEAEGGPTTAATGADFAVNGVTLTIPAGEMTGTATLSLTPTDDPIAEGDETAQVSGAADGLTVTPAPVTIVDNDREPTGIELSVTPSEVKEDAGATDLTVTATLIDGDARGVDTEVALSVSGVTATETVDYTAQTDVTLTIPDGQMSHTATLTLTPVDDGIRESAEQVAVRGTNASAGLPVSGARVTIADNDANATAITLSLDRDMIPEDGGAQRLTVTGTLNGDLRSVDTRVTLSLTGLTATDSDYTALPATLVIGAGQREGTATVVLDPTNDDIDEPDETLEVRGQARSAPRQQDRTQQSGPQSALTVSGAQVTITDDDTAGVTVAPTAFTVLEGSSRNYTVVLDTQPTEDVTVTVSLPGGSDLSVSPTSLTFTASNWSVARTVTVIAGEDNDLADDGEVTIGHAASSTDPLYAAATPDSVTVTVNDDDDTVSVTFGAATYTVAEGATTTIEVILSAAPEQEVTIPIIETGQGGISEDDYSGVPESVIFAATDTEKSFTFSAAADDVDDDDESVALAFGALPEGVTAGTTSASTVSITDDDVPAVTVGFGAATYTVAEGGTVDVTVTLDVAPERAVTIPLIKTGQGGISEDDYSGVPESVVFNSGDTEQSFTFSAAADDVDDDEESLKLTLGTLPTGVTAGTTSTSTVSITDDDVPSVTVGFGAATYTVAEGGTVDVTVTLDIAPEREVTIPLIKTGQGGTSEDDYSGVPESVTFAATDIEKSFTFSATADEVDDDDESVKLSFGTLPDGVNAGTIATSTVSITDDDDPAVTVGFGAATSTVDEGGTVDVTVTLDFAPEREVTIPIVKTDQGGVSEDDYSGVPESLTFATTDTEKSFTFSAAADEVDDDDESVALAFGTLPDGVTSGATSTTTVTITDDDVPSVSVSFGAATYSVGEDGTVEVTVTLDVAPEREVTIPIVKTDEGGISEDDYSGVPESVIFEAADTEKSFTFSATQDDVDDDDESVALAFGTLPDRVSAGTTSTTTVSITDDDVPDVTVGFGQSSYSVDEGDTVDVTVTLSAAPEREVTIPIAKTDQGRISEDDYSGVPESVIIGATETEKSFSFSAAEDDVDDDDESVGLSFGTLPDGMTAGATSTSTVSIVDDDVPEVTVSFGSATYSVAESDTVEVTLTLDVAPEQEVTIPIAKTDQGGITQDDYSGVPESVIFAATDTEKSFTFSATADEVDDDDESVGLAFGTLPEGVSAGTTSTSTVSITDDDEPSVSVSFSAATYSVAEDGTVEVTVTLDVAPEREVTIPIVKTDQGGASEDDYSGVPESVIFAATHTEKSFTFSATADDVDDDDESVALAFGTFPEGVSAGTTTASTVSIIDDDVPAVTVSFAQATYSVDENGTVDVTVTLDAAPEREVTIPIAKTDQGGASEDDYSGVPESVIFGAADTEKSFTFTAAVDEVDDDDESVALAFGTLPEGVSAGTTSTTTVSIIDGDEPDVTVSFGSATYTAAEGGTVDVTVTLDAAPEREVTIPIAKTDQGGISEDDYSGVPESVIFGAADTEKSFTFTAAVDEVDDDDESVALAFGTLPTGVIAGNTASSTVNITDDDVPAGTVSLVLTPATIDESGSSNVSTVTATLATASSADTTVTISAPQDAPVTLSSNRTLTIVKGATTSTGEVTITAVNDAVYTGDREVTVSGAASNTVGVANPEDATLTITDDEVRPVTVSFGAATYSVAEGGTVDVTVTLDAAPDREVTIPIVKADEGGTSAADYSGVPASVIFGAAETEKSFTFSAAADDVDDDEESVGLAFGTLPEGVSAGTSTTTVSITDDDIRGVTIDPTSFTVIAGRTNSYSVVLDTQPTANVTVTVSGHVNTDLSLDRTSLTFTADNWNAAQTVTVTADENAVARSVTLTHAINGADYGSVSADDATVNILAAPSSITIQVGVTVSQQQLSVVEGGSRDYSLVLNTAPTDDVTVDITLPSGTDLSLDSATLTFTTANWSTPQTITVSADEDDDATTDDPVQVSHTVSGGGYDNTAVPDVRVTITENDLFDAEATYRVLTRYGSPTEVELSEYIADGVTGVTFALESCDDTRSDYYNSAAVENGKLRLASNTLGHIHGENTQGETVCTVTATSADGYQEKEFRLYTVSDRTPTPLLVGDLTLAEARPTELDVQVALPEGAIAYVRLAWRKPGGQFIFRVVSGVTDETVLTIPGLEAGSEYEVRAALMTFQSFDLYRVGNTGPEGTLIPEGSPAVKWVRNLARSGLGRSQAITTRTAYGISVSIEDVEALEDVGSMSFDVTLDQESTNVVTVDWATSDGTAEAPGDYEATTSGQLTFAAGQTKQTLEVTIVDDAVDEAEEETFTVTLSNAANADLGVASATGTITDDDVPAVTVSLALTPATIDESGSSNVSTVTATLATASSADTTVTISAPQDAPVTLSSNRTLTIVKGATTSTGEVTITAVNDAVYTGDREVTVSGAASNTVGVANPEDATLTITDDEVRPVTVSFGQATYSVAEGGTVDVTVTLDAAPDREVTIPIVKADEGGTSAADYSGVPASMIFGAAETEKSFTFNATQDDVDDDGESVRLAFGTLPAQVTRGTTDEAVVSITDDDAPTSVAVSFGQSTYSVAEGSAVTVTIQLDDDPEKTVTVPVSAAGQNGASAADYSGVPASVTFNAGTTEQTFAVAATQDTVDDDGESVKLTFGALPTGVSAGATASTTVSITDDDVPTVTVSFGAATYTVAEGGTVGMTVTLDVAPEREVKIPIAKTDEGGITQDDYSGVPASVTFGVTDTEKSFTFSADDDDVDDDGESVKLAFGTLPAQVTGGATDEAVVSITDDDAPTSVAVSFGQSTYSVAEGSAVTITVQLDDDPEKTVTVPVSAAGQNGASADDYSGVPASVTFNSGDTSKSFSFTAAADDLDDDGESVALAFGTLPSGVTAGTTGTTTVSITDGDVPDVTVGFGAATYTVAEGSSVTVNVTLSAAPEREVTIPITATDQGGVGVDDYSGVPASVTFGAADTSKSFTFSAAQDDVDDDGESVKLAFGTLPAQVTGGATDEAVVSITDDDAPTSVAVSFGQSTYSVAEGSAVTITVRLDDDPEKTVTVPVSAAGQSGASADDYSGVPASVTFNSGDTSKSFTFTAVADGVDDDGESVALAFGTLPSGVTAGTTGTTTVSITDDDVPAVTVSFGAATYTVAEGSSVTVKVTLSAAPEREVTIPITAADPGRGRRRRLLWRAGLRDLQRRNH